MDSFADSAARLAGLAGLMFGWRPGEFWDATPAELGSVIGAMMGEGGGLSAMDVDKLKRMLGNAPPPSAFAKATADGPPPLQM